MSHQALKLITPPSGLAVALAEVKNYLRVNGTTDDTMLTSFIVAATDAIELATSRRLLTQTWAFYMDRFPGRIVFDSNWSEGTREGKLSEFLVGQSFITIPLYPLQSVTHLKTYDDDNTAYTMSSSEYYVDTVSEPGRISLKNSGTWPDTFLRPANGIEIQFVCGYGASADIPVALKQAVMEMVAKFYESRGCSDSSLSATAIALIRPYKLMRIG